jgi:thiosulfate/3-mercaptopyruvate sulfurtransferase
LDEVRTRPGSVTLLDTRDRREFDGATPYGSAWGGRIPGARHVDWSDFIDGDGLISRESARALLGPQDQPVVAYCTGGVRSGFVYAVARWAGYDDVANYAGSWWEYSAETEPPAE